MKGHLRAQSPQAWAAIGEVSTCAAGVRHLVDPTLCHWHRRVLTWNTLSKEGPTITISFQNAEGLQAGQS